MGTMKSTKDQIEAAIVKRRRVFFISGFDPKGPAHYQAVYDQESQKQAALGGYKIEVEPAKRRGKIATIWEITAQFDGRSVQTQYEFLRWDDIMRKHMQVENPPFLVTMFITYWLYATNGVLWKMLKISYPPFIAAIYPALILIALAVIGLAATGVVCWALIGMFGLAEWLAVPIAALCFAALIWFARRLEKTLPFLWPVHVYNFAAAQVRGDVEEIEARIDHFAGRITEYIATSKDDEVLIVGHSNGTSIALSALAKALQRDPGLADHHPKVSFLTLGQSILMVSLLPKAEQFRRELQLVAGDNGVDWIDLTAPRDGACFALVDPVAASGLQPQGAIHEAKPKLLSVPISDLFSPQTWKKTLHRRWLRIHFQYFMAYEKPTPYDYFAITAGPLTLADRYRSFPSKTGFSKFKLFGK